MNLATPGITRRAAILLPGLAKLAVAQGENRQTVEFSGHSWDIKTGRLSGPGPNPYAGGNVLVKPDGMHLRICRREGKWACAEAVCRDRLGYGLYKFELSDVSRLDPNMVLGLFSWDPDASAHHYNEIDIELGRWGNANAPSAQFVLQPWDEPDNRVRFNVPAGRIEYSFEWTPGRVTCRAAQGRSTIHQCVFEKAVPSPGGAQARVNFWLFQSRPPQREAEVVVKNFQFTAI